jgi:hypothetical protein
VAGSSLLEPVPEGPATEALGDAYRLLQVAVGCIAIGLPPGVWAFRGLRDGSWHLLNSISAHYYSSSRNLFVGALCAQGVFFLSYQVKPLPGYENDRWLGRAAAVLNIAIAFCPTAPEGHKADTANVIHGLAAISFFVLLAYIANFVFTRSSGNPTPEKLQRNRAYRVLGGTIVAALVVGAICRVAHVDDSTHWLFWVETVAIEAFGLSWLLKSGATPVLRDK